MANAADGLQTALASAKTVDDVARVLREAEAFIIAAREELAAMLREEGMSPWEITEVLANTRTGSPLPA